MELKINSAFQLKYYYLVKCVLNFFIIFNKTPSLAFELKIDKNILLANIMKIILILDIYIKLKPKLKKFLIRKKYEGAKFFMVTF